MSNTLSVCKFNQVYPTIYQGMAAVEKHFFSLEDWQREQVLYAQLAGRLPLSDLLFSQPGVLILKYHNKPTLLAELERQEREGFDPLPWRTLAQWLRQCHTLCQKLPSEGDLRNFLWDRAANQIIGLDLECYRPCAVEDCGKLFLHALQEFSSRNTTVQSQISSILAEALGMPLDSSNDSCLNRQPLQCLSGIVLAGGASRRMGRNKAELCLNGKSLLQLQVEKMRALGIEDIMLSGAACPHLPGTRVIPDELPGNGPLGGLHACFGAAKHTACLVLSVDVPLVPLAALSYLCRGHQGDITMLRHGTWKEPLMAVYSCELAEKIPPLIAQGNRSLRELERISTVNFFDYLGPESLLNNCNTPEEFAKVSALAETFSAVGLSLFADYTAYNPSDRTEGENNS